MTPMAGVYLDTSALGRVMLGEPDSAAIGAVLASADAIVSSHLLGVELHRLGLRTGIAAEEVDVWLTGVALVPMDEAIVLAARAVMPASIATLDAVHLATALRLAADGHIASMMTFDERLADGAREHGLAVVAPS